jgi:hypothetical protein
VAKIGSIVLGGRESGCGIAFHLSAPAPLSHLYVPKGESWKIEMQEGEMNIVARTSDPLDRPEVLSQGLEQVQRCLDLLSFGKRLNLIVKRAGDDHVMIFARNGDYVAQHVDVSSFAMEIGSIGVTKGNDENVLSPNPTASVWTPGLRFYRFSQSSSDLYNAYRYLWLGLEALLVVICPKRPQEREREWLNRAMLQVGTSINLKQFVSKSCSDPVAYILGTQYDHIRCRLFHAKVASPVTRSDIPNLEEVSSAYDGLIRLWREIAMKCLSVPSSGGGAFSYQGFKMMLDSLFSKKLRMYFTDDASPAKKEDTEVSPNGHPVFQFADVTYLSETAPGRVSFWGSQPLVGMTEIPAVFRICSKAGDSLLATSFIDEGLFLDGVDYLESHNTFRLINLNLPRIVFGDEI